MEPIWFKRELSEEIMKNNDIFDQMNSIVADIMSEKIDITHVVENMAGVLTNKEVEKREKGMRFFTKLLGAVPKDYLTEMQVELIAKFYIDRMKDHHNVIPEVLKGCLVIIDMKNYNMSLTGKFLNMMFKEIHCQSQLRQDRFNIYLIVKKFMDMDLEYMKSLGPDFVYGFISAMDGERDPRNLLYLFEFLPFFLKHIPLAHLVDQMFDVISCYYPIDFHPSPDDPAAIKREDLAAALSPCLCAIPEFAEQCLILLVEKLDSSLRMAKVDSFRLLAQSCKTFKAESYKPFLKALWSLIHRETSNKTDEELNMAAHEALSALVANLSTTANTDQSFEVFLKAILISMQTEVAESTTIAQFVQATKVLLTTANASKESCIIITKAMIPATVAYYEFRTSSKLQIASLEFLVELYEIAKHWDVLKEIGAVLDEIPKLCLTAVSEPKKEYQIAGFKTLIKVKNELKSDLVLPFVEILIHNIQFSQESDLLTVCVETVHAIARKYPELIMNFVVKGKCDLDNLTQDKKALQKRLNLLSNLASIDDFTKVIIEEMLNIISTNETDAPKVVEALSENMSITSLYTEEKLTQIESDHGLIDSILVWILKEIKGPQQPLYHGYTLISNTISSLPREKQLNVLAKYGPDLIEKCKNDEIYIHVLESLYSSVSNSICNLKFEELMSLCLKLSLNSDNEDIRTKACVLIAHFLNKAEHGIIFELLYDVLKDYLASCSRENESICPRLINLYGWITKALIMRGSDLFLFWLQKIMSTLSNPDYCKYGSEAIQLIMFDHPEYLNSKRHCRISLLYKQRIFQNFATLSEKLTLLNEDAKETYFLSWAYILGNVPKTVLNNQVNKVVPIVIDSLEYDNKELLIVMTDVLCHFIQSKHESISNSLQTILPRLINLTRYVKSMDVRIKSLQCLYEIANSYRTSLLLPHKQDVLIELVPSLDDKKRLVRNMAVRARSRWFIVGSPGENKEN